MSIHGPSTACGAIVAAFSPPESTKGGSMSRPGRAPHVAARDHLMVMSPLSLSVPKPAGPKLVMLTTASDSRDHGRLDNGAHELHHHRCRPLITWKEAIGASTISAGRVAP
jgi:hypothetical protein